MTPFEWIMVIAAALAAATGGYSAYQQKRAADREADIYAANAAIAEAEAERKAEEAEERKRRLLASQHARYGAAGISLEGTPLEVMAQTAIEADEDISEILRQGGVEQWNWRARSGVSETRATAGIYQGASTILTGATEIAGGMNRKPKPKKNGITAYDRDVMTTSLLRNS